MSDQAQGDDDSSKRLYDAEMVLKWRQRQILKKLPSMVMHAVERDNIALVQTIFALLESQTLRQQLVEKKVKNHMEKRTFLHEAVRLGSLDLVKLLVSYGSDIKAKTKGEMDGTMPIHQAIFQRKFEVVRYFLDNFPEAMMLEAKTSSELTPLMCAARNGSVEMVELLLARNANIEARDYEARTPLMHAALCCKPEVVELLINRGAKITARDKSYDRCLVIHLPVQSYHDGNEETVRKLVELKPELLEALTKKTKRTPLHVAVIHGSTQAVQMLVSLGANLEARDSQGHTPLMLTNESICRYEMPRILIEKGADPYALNSKGDTLIHMATRSWKSRVVRALLEVKPELINAKNTSGETPLQVWNSRNHPEYGDSEMERIFNNPPAVPQQPDDDSSSAAAQMA